MLGLHVGPWPFAGELAAALGCPCQGMSKQCAAGSQLGPADLLPPPLPPAACRRSSACVARACLLMVPRLLDVSPPRSYQVRRLADGEDYALKHIDLQVCRFCCGSCFCCCSQLLLPLLLCC